MEQKILTIKKNELMQTGTKVYLQQRAENQDFCRIYDCYGGSPGNYRYYACADKAVTSDIICRIRLHSLGNAGGVYKAVIKKGKRQSEAFATTLLFKATTLLSFSPAQDENYIYAESYESGVKTLEQVIGDNILYDYAQGLRNTAISVGCCDFQDIEGQSAVKWTQGEAINADETVYIDDNQKFWRVTGRKFKKEGAPFVDLELQQTFLKE